jgi:biotin-(acetyl-CoA carboxylase) ligase
MKDVFSSTWEKQLAFRGEQVEIQAEGVPLRVGKIEGLEKNGTLRLRSTDGQVFAVQFGEVHVRPVL